MKTHWRLENTLRGSACAMIVFGVNRYSPVKSGPSRREPCRHIADAQAPEVLH